MIEECSQIVRKRRLPLRKTAMTWTIEQFLSREAAQVEIGTIDIEHEIALRKVQG